MSRELWYDIQIEAMCVRGCTESQVMSLDQRKTCLIATAAKLREMADRVEVLADPEARLIECTEHVTGNLRLWWKPESKGYTTQIENAGRYSPENASRIAKLPDEAVWCLEGALAAATRVIPR